MIKTYTASCFCGYTQPEIYLKWVSNLLMNHHWKLNHQSEEKI